MRLHDNDWVVASKHKLIPSVYWVYQIHKENVGYSGTTYIAIRPGKHASIAAEFHAFDLDEIFELECDNVRKMVYIDFGEIKPVFIFMVDGRPDQACIHIHG